MNTAYPDFQDALYTVCSGATDTPVSLGYPAGGLKKAHVWIAGSGSIEMSDGVSGYGQHDETMTTEIRIKVEKLTNEYAVVRDEACAILSDIVAAMKADVTLGGVVAFARVTQAIPDEAIPDERTRMFGLVVTVTAQAAVG